MIYHRDMKPKRIYNKTEIVTRRYETYFYFHDDLRFTNKEIDTDMFTISSAKVDSNNNIQEYTKEKFDELTEYIYVPKTEIQSEKINKLFNFFEQIGFEKSPKWYAERADTRIQRAKSMMEYSLDKEHPYIMIPPKSWKYDKYGAILGNMLNKGTSYEMFSYGNVLDGFPGYTFKGSKAMANPIRDSIILGRNHFFILRGTISPQSFQSFFFHKYPMSYYVYSKDGVQIPSKDIAYITLKNGDIYEV